MTALFCLTPVVHRSAQQPENYQADIAVWPFLESEANKAGTIGKGCQHDRVQPRPLHSTVEAIADDSGCSEIPSKATI